MEKSIGMEKMEYVLGKKKYSLDDLKEFSKIESKVEVLRDFGFENCYVMDNLEEYYESIQKSIEKMTENDPNTLNKVSLVLFYFAIPNFSSSDSPKSDLSIFDYRINKILSSFGLDAVKCITLTQQGCSGSFEMIEIANNFLRSGEHESILCISADFLPNESREIMYNIISDSVCTFLVEIGASKNKLVSFYQVNQNTLWNSSEDENRILASYFPMAKKAIEGALLKANLNIEDIDLIIPHNVSHKSWEILSKMIGFPLDQIYLDQISKIGHTVSSDHIINLKNAELNEKIKKGSKLLLFTFGFGASWSVIILEN